MSECKQCLTTCTEDRNCRCCTARMRRRAEAAEAEVDALRTEVEELNEAVQDSLRLLMNVVGKRNIRALKRALDGGDHA